MTRHVHRPRLLWLFAAFAACCSVWRSPGQAFVSASGAWGMRHAPCGPLVSAIRLYAGPTAEAARVELRDETRLLRETVTDLVSEVRLLRQELTGQESPATGQTAPREEAKIPTAPEAPPTRASDVPPKTRSKGPPKGTTAVKVVSAGGDAGDIADFFLEDQQVPIGGMSNRRGLNVVVIDASAGHLLSAKTYDIWGNPLEENRRLAKDLRAVEEDNVVLVALKDSGMENLDGEALHALQGLGSTLERRLAFREGYALIGVKDGEALAERKGRMVMAEAKLPFAVRPPQAPVRAAR
ncbi:FAM3C [Symbiodinium natans]|uniref:FAM3C protein n=1 Tax=Symbiodinium natans TaxID=878477 RepID=A0A812S023_9DINO|nr:FAM3C [Symbiodinium natans]